MSKDPIKKRVPRKRNRKMTEAALLESAMTLFSKQGFDATTTKAIADLAKVNEQLIQRYFGGKEGLLIAIMQHFRTQFMDQSPFVKAEGEDLFESLNHMFSASPGYFSKCVDLIRIGFSQSLLSPKVSRAIYKKITTELIPENIKKMKGFQEKGWMDSDLDLWSTTYGIMLLMFGIGFVGKFVHRMPQKQLKKTADQMAKILARGLLSEGVSS